MQEYNTLTGESLRIVGSQPFVGNKYEDLGNGLLKITYNSLPSFLEVGSCYMGKNWYPRETAGIFGYLSKNLSLENLNIHHLYGFGATFQISENVSIDRVNIMPREGTGRYCTSYADHIQMSGVAGEVSITNCFFANPLDDPINVHGTYMEIKEISRDTVTGTTKMVVEYMQTDTAGFKQFFVGNKIDVASRAYMTYVGSNPEDCIATVVDVTHPFEDDMPGNKTTITVDKILPDLVVPNSYVVENITYTPNVTIKGNRFTEAPTRGVLLTTRGESVIEDNIFEAMGMSGIFISCDSKAWYESGPVHNVTIRNNIFNAQDGNAAIEVYPEVLTGNDPSGKRVHKNITIENNTFNMSKNNKVLKIDKVEGLTFKNNTINRHNPQVQFNLSATNVEDAKVGNSYPTTLTSSARSINGTLYEFNYCKDVTVEGNTYDNGFNQKYINNNSSNVVINDDVTTSDNLKPSVSDIFYASENPEIVSINSLGVITPISEGTTNIYAYTRAGSRIFMSNKLKVTVSGSNVDENAPTFINVSANSNVLAVNDELQCSVTVDSGKDNSVTYSIRDPYTKGVTDKATVSSAGLVTALKRGVVEVVATSTLNGGVYGTKLLSISQGLGQFDASVWEIFSDTPANYNLDSDNNRIFANFPLNSSPFWGNDSGKNIFLTTPDSIGETFEATVKITGKGNVQYNQSNLIFFIDQSNFVSVGQHQREASGNARFGMVHEVNGSCAETFPTGQIVDGASPIWLKLSKNGNVYTGSYSKDGINYTPIANYTNAVVGNNFKVGFFNGSGQNAGNNSYVSFEDLTINDVKIPFYVYAQKELPKADNLSVLQNLNRDTTISYTYTSDEVEQNSVYRWYVSDSETGVFKLIDDFTTKTVLFGSEYIGKYVKAEVVPVNAKGFSGDVYATPAKQIVQDDEDVTDARLVSLNIAGLDGFKPEINNYSIIAPPTSSNLKIDAKAVQSGATVKVFQDGLEKASGKSSVNVNLPIQAGSTLITVEVTASDGVSKMTYSINTMRKANSDAYLSSLSTENISTPITFSKEVLTYVSTVKTDERLFNLNLAANDAEAKVKVAYNYKTLQDFDDNKNDFNMELPILGGSNVVQIFVQAADGVTTRLYRVSIARTASSISTASDIKLDGQTIAKFDPNTYSYMIKLDSYAGGNIFATSTSPNATITYFYNGTVTTGALPALTNTRNVITVGITPENKGSTTYYVITILLPDSSNADLEFLNINGLTPLFNANILNYTVNIDEADAFSVSAATADNDATITLTFNNKAFGTTANTVSQNIDVLKENNILKLDVVSKNGTKKTYTITVKAKIEVVYLSDISWYSAVVGYDQPIRDAGPDGNKISIKGVTYDKGLYAHATSNITYNIQEGVYERFIAYAGINGTGNDINSSVLFKVFANDNSTPVWQSSKILRFSDEAELIDIPLQNITTLRLSAEQGENNWSDHSVWADAKFIKRHYTVTYNLNGGTNHDYNVEKYLDGSKTILLEAPTKEGSSFEGWYDNANFEGEPVTQIEQGSTGNKTFWAKWGGAHTYTVTFDSNGGSHVDNVNVENNAAIPEPSAPTKKYYSFVGWYSDLALTTKWDFNTNKVSNNITLYAKWEILKGDANGDGIVDKSDAKLLLDYVIGVVEELPEDAIKAATGNNGSNVTLKHVLATLKKAD